MKNYLSDINSKGKYIVESIKPNSKHFSRLLGQGFYAHKEFEVLAVFTDKYILKIGNAKLTLDKVIAKEILIKTCRNKCFWEKIGIRLQQKIKHQNSLSPLNSSSQSHTEKNKTAAIKEVNNRTNHLNR